jgi:hypothetical protein
MTSSDLCPDRLLTTSGDPTADPLIASPRTPFMLVFPLYGSRD